MDGQTIGQAFAEDGSGTAGQGTSRRRFLRLLGGGAALALAAGAGLDAAAAAKRDKAPTAPPKGRPAPPRAEVEVPKRPPTPTARGGWYALCLRTGAYVFVYTPRTSYGSGWYLGWLYDPDTGRWHYAYYFQYANYSRIWIQRTY